MQGTGKTYEVSGQTTEWEDILIKKGIRTKEQVLIEKGLNPDDFAEKQIAPQEEEETLEDFLESATEKELDELEEDDEFIDSRTLEGYRQRRLQELKEASVKNRFGDVVEIVKDEWISEVTECSKGCWVVVHLYQDYVTECRLLEGALQILAARFSYIKFLKIRSTQAVENWPERNLPTLFLYNQGELKEQLITLSKVGGKTMQPQDLEWWFVKKGIITTSELQEDPREGEETERRQVTRVGVFKARSSEYGEDDDDD